MTKLNSRLAAAALLLATALAAAQQSGPTPKSPFGDSGTVIPKRPIPTVPPYKPEPLDPVLRQAAIKQIQGAAVDNNPHLRTQAVEAAAKTMGAGAKPIIIHAFTDIIVPVRYNACIAAGDLRLTETAQMLHKLAYEEDPSVRLAARYGLHKLGDTTLTQELASYGLTDDRIAVRGNAVMLLGMLGEPSAIKPLRSRMKDPSSTIRLQVTEAMWRLGADEALEDLVSRSISPFADDQTIAIFALSERRQMGEEQRRNVINYIRGFLVANFPEVELAAARALGNMGKDDGFGVALKYADSNETRQRVLSAMAFGDIGRSDAQSVLKKMLEEDKTGEVRLSAAASILKLKPPQN